MIDEAAMENAASIIVNGLVQGVGFRWFVTRHAQQLGLKGCVKNNFDGSVSVEAEGESSMIEELIKELKIGPRSAQVKGVSVEWKKPTNLFQGFTIR